ncbi:MAG: DUF4173 domain-containing protein [Planctomycetes bacterium]|nr:DUF4173 domain-containing protein [Planctomycetota bacterium]MBL7040436.1 DUF4173 domain-containing protein [Pirellulaceae bacterium]
MSDAPEYPVTAEIVNQPNEGQAESAAESAMMAATREQPPLRLREVFAVLLMVVLCDVTIYRGEGFAGLALLFVVAPVLLLVGSFRPRFGLSFWLIGFMLVALAAKMLWCVSWLPGLHVAAGFVLLVAFAMSLSGLCPYVLEGVVYASQTILAGYAGIVHYLRSTSKKSPAITRASWLSVTLPVVAFLMFGVLFILANPDLLASFGKHMEELLTRLRDWIINFSPSPWEFFFWIAVFWISVGLLRPVIGRALFEVSSRTRRVDDDGVSEPAEAFVYPAFRNTLITVIVLFAVYLGFELKTLWFRDFPEDFHYSGYAHQGAAWLTLGLALSTAILSVVFRGRVLQDPRLPRLRGLAWIWSLENMMLAIAVYHRLYIYIGFNGMTRMRTVGFFGMSAVVAGFILVLWKIAHNRDFLWLVRRHLWTLAVTIYLFVLTPVDTIVVSYNVRRILAGDPAPSVEIDTHPINAEGIVLLEPLLECNDEIIREGVRATLAEWHEEAEALALERQRKGWTSFQAADKLALEELRAASHKWSEYKDRDERSAVLEAFHKYAHQWY